MPSQLRVLLAEDHPLMREAITRLLSEHCIVAGTVERGDAVMAAVRDIGPDAVVMDISMPGRSGLQVLPELRALDPQVVIILITNHDSPAYKQAAIERGADGYVLKQMAASDLWHTLRDAWANIKNAKAALRA